MSEQFLVLSQAWSEPWFLRSTLLVVVVAILCALIGNFLVLRRMSLLSDAVSHSVLPGVVISYLLAGYSYAVFLSGSVAAAISSVILIGWLTRHTKLKEDAAMGIVFTSFFSLGIVLLTALRDVDLDPGCVVYGEALAAREGSLELAIGILVLAITLLLVFYKELQISSFDRIQAELSGVPVWWIHYGLLTLLALATVASLRAVGIVLAIALFITPAATAYLLTNRLFPMIVWSVVLAGLEALIGMQIAVLWNLNPSGLIAFLSMMVFLCVLAIQASQRRWRLRQI